MGEKASFTGREADRTNTVARQEHADSADLTEVSGAIKWFDVAKGYGFILPDEPHLGDILLHVTCLRRDGFQTAQEGARIVCLVKQGDRGLQAFRVLSIDMSTATHPTELPEQRTHVVVTPESGLERALVKWFNRTKGFGFLTRGEGTEDIFVQRHRIAARTGRSGPLRTGREGPDGCGNSPRRWNSAGFALTADATFPWLSVYFCG
jgi:CspA family cold shock protein